MLLRILEDALFQRHLGRWIDREGQGEMLLQSPDRLDGRILLASLGFRCPGFLRCLALLRLGTFRFGLLFFRPQAVTQFG